MAFAGKAQAAPSELAAKLKLEFQRRRCAISRALARKRRVTAKLKVRATDAAGNARTSRHRVKLKR